MGKWNKQDTNWLKKNYKALGPTRCAEILGRSYGSVESKAYRFGYSDPTVVAEDSNSYETAKEALNKLIGFQMDQQESSFLKATPEDQYTVAIMPCLHIPFESKNNLASFIAAYGASIGEYFLVDELVIAGDFLDCLSMGHAGYKKNIRPNQYKTLAEELAAGKAVMAELSARFPKVTIMRGNHIDRVRKYFAERLSPELMFLVNYDITQILAEDFNNVQTVSLESKNGDDLGWIYQIGDVRICHAEVGSSIELRPTVRLDKWFQEWEATINDLTDLPPYNVLVECHTHQAGILHVNSGAKTLVEGGCLCLTPQYSIEPSVPYSRPQTNAVTIVSLIDGKAIKNSIHQIVYEKME